MFLAGKGGAFSSLRGIGASSEELGGGGSVGGSGGGGGGGGSGGGGGGGAGGQVAVASDGGGGGAEKIWTGMSLGCCFLCALLRLGAGWMEGEPSGGTEGPRLMRESGCEGYGSEGATLACGVFRRY